MNRSIIFIFLLIMLSCNDNSKKIDKKTISRLSQGDFSIPSVHGFLYLFFSVEGDEKGQGNVNVLHDIYIRYYRDTYEDFSSFLSEALNQKIIFKKKELESHDIIYFKINRVVDKHYHDLTLNNFIEYYCNKENENNFFVKQKYYNDEYLMSILYYLFINNYDVTSDDYLGKYKIRTIR